MTGAARAGKPVGSLGRGGPEAPALRRMPGGEQRGSAFYSAQLAATPLFTGIGLSPLEQFLTASDAPVVDGAGQAWRSHQIWGASALLGLSTMVLAGVIALIRLRRASH
jgi:hypothetical protein